MISKSDALISLGVNGSFWELPTGKIKFNDNYNGIKPTEEQIQAKLAELQAAEPLRLLRIERDKLLTASDWRMTKDYPYADQLDWEDYRFELRELPQRIANGEVSAPTLNENGMLVFDEWPLKPGETA